MTDENNVANGAAGEEAEGPQFALQRVYLKDMSFESPQGAEIFKKTWQPKVSQDLNTAVNKLSEDFYEVVLKITIETQIEEKTAFLIEVQQAGLFVIKGIEGQQLAQVLNTACPQLIFPYAREAIDNAAVRGSFPAMNLPPINFEMLYMHAMQQAQKEQQEAPAAEPN